MSKKEKKATEMFTEEILTIMAAHLDDLQLVRVGYYEKLRAERVQQQMQRKAEAGYAVHRPPLGYTKTSKPGLFAINSKGKAMAELLNKYADGKISSTELHNSLSTVFSPLPKGIRTKDRLCDYISNPYYSGYVSYKNKNYKGKHQALLTEEKLTQVVLKLYAEVRMDFPLAGSNHQR